MATRGPLSWTPLGDGGGFSGAALWRGADASGAPHFALKQWPETMTAARLAEIHRWMKQASGLPFVPRVATTNDGGTLAVEAGRVWDLTTWMKGAPVVQVSNLHEIASEPGSEFRLTYLSSEASATGSVEVYKLETCTTGACTALAALHRAWRTNTPRVGPVPAVQRRLAILDDWRGEPGSVARFIEPARRALRPWLQATLPLQPCLCDVHGQHVLFTGEAATGIVDYGAMKIDHVAVDLARYLGDVCGDDETAFESGLEAYRESGGEIGTPSSFVRLLDRTGLVCASIGWHRRPNPNRVRVAQLAARLGALRGI